MNDVGYTPKSGGIVLPYILHKITEVLLRIGVKALTGGVS